ncbi:MAG TPA: hypothetical protein VMG10_24395 [Gemmataceae bacterium]|nr:hypothetical protein [Gemmataceae bacterium]
MSDTARQGGAALRVFVPSILVVSLLIVSLFLLVCGYLADPTAFNSDNLLSSAQCDDLLHGRDLTDWHLPGAPYVFPDLLLLLPCQGLAPTLPLAFLAYCLVLHLTLAASLAWLGRLSELRWQTAIVAAGCGAIFLVAMYLNKVMSDRACLLVHPGSHVAALVVGVFLLVLTIHSLKRPSWILAILYLLIAGLGSFSDRLLVAQFLAPLALALMLLAARRVIGFKPAAMHLALIAGSFLLSCVLQLLFQRIGFHLLTLDTAISRLHPPDFFRMLRRLYQGIADDHLLCILIPLHLLVLLLVVWIWSRRAVQTTEETGPNRPVVLLAALTFVLSPLCILGALFVLGMSNQAAISRYVLSCWFLPPLLLPLLTCWLPGKTARAAAVLLQGAILLFALQRAAVVLPNVDRQLFEQPYPPLAQALDRLARQRGPLKGLGSFWTARSATWFAREKVVVNALSAMGEPWFHASNPARFLPDDGELGVPPYQLLVVRRGDTFGPSASVLALQYGMPDERIMAGTDEIWLYSSLRVPALDRFLRTRLADRLHRRRPYTGPIEPACLAQPKANMTPLNSAGTVALEPKQVCEVRFAQPITGRVLDVGASAESRLEVEFYRGAARLGGLVVPSVPWTGACYDKPGIQSRLLPLPAMLCERSWDRLLLRPRADSPNVCLAHVLVFADGIPGLDEERLLPRVPRIRLEAEELLPINPGTPFTDDADATASGGHVRRAAVDLRCCVNCTPRLFLPAGRYRLECALKVDSNSTTDDVITLLVGCLSPQAKLAEHTLRGSDFSAAGRWETHQVTFEVPEEMENVQFGIVDSGKTPITVDYLELIAEPPSSPGEKK